MDILPLTWEQREPWAELLAISFGRPPSEMKSVLDHLHDKLVAYGAWEGDRLAAQYSCLSSTLQVPGIKTPLQVGMSINMAVHPEYRGRGLIKQVAHPVYKALAARGGVAGVGFSNAAGVRVDRQSKGYGYRVVGRMVPTLGWLYRRPSAEALALSENWPDQPLHYTPDNKHIRFSATRESIQYRFIEHPFRRYHFGVWESGGQMRGVVVYRPMHWKRIVGASLIVAYSDELPALISRWASAIWERGARLVRVLSSPTSLLLAALKQVAFCVPLPYSRSPYYLTVKPLHQDTPAILFDFSRWDCVGGDIL